MLNVIDLIEIGNNDDNLITELSVKLLYIAQTLYKLKRDKNNSFEINIEFTAHACIHELAHGNWNK